MMDSLKQFVDLLMAAQEKGLGVYFVLWMVVVACLVVALVMFRRDARHTKASIDDLSKRLDDCEKKHTETDLRYTRLQKRHAIVTGVLVASIGARPLPAGFWQAVVDDDALDFPELITLRSEPG